MDQKNPRFHANKKTILIVGFLIVALVGIPLTVYFLQQTQIIEQQAWHTSQSASAACGPDGKVVITVNFSNTENNNPANAMNVTVRDTVTGGTVNLGTVNPGEAKSGTITTNATSLAAGGVIFSLVWTNGRPGTDTRSASYSAVSACVQEPTATPTPTIPDEPTITSTATPTIPDEPTATPTDVPTVTPTGNPTETPTPIISTTETPTPTTGVTDTPTTQPTEVVVSSDPTNTPFPTIAPSGPETLFVGLGAAALVLTLIGGLLFFLL